MVPEVSISFSVSVDTRARSAVRGRISTRIFFGGNQPMSSPMRACAAFEGLGGQLDQDLVAAGGVEDDEVLGLAPGEAGGRLLRLLHQRLEVGDLGPDPRIFQLLEDLEGFPVVALEEGELRDEVLHLGIVGRGLGQVADQRGGVLDALLLERAHRLDVVAKPRPRRSRRRDGEDEDEDQAPHRTSSS
jgi:hypothetical protein